ncbi:hypothetical protein FBQ82_09190 [Anaerolineae bacterium CFX7]|nr:hypothetical protein [Anaerolineae bacterium CFX7]
MMLMKTDRVTACVTRSGTINAQNLPQTLNGTNPYITSASYNASDQTTNLTFQSGTTTTYTNVTYQYNNPAHKHAVTQAGANYFCYDANSNLTRRATSGR